MENKNSNPLMCDIETGMCEMPAYSTDNSSQELAKVERQIKVVYFTDPICSTCWGIEPQLRKLKLEYGADLSFEYRMGGLLPDWGYSSGGISKPADVAQHWDEVSLHYDMPIDGDVWLKDPLHSSYPPSIAFKAAQMQDEEKAIQFLRRIREMVFLEKKNIAKWEHLLSAANETRLDVVRFEQDFNGKAKDAFEEDLELARQYGVRGFPTFLFSDGTGNQQKIYGIKPYKVFENAVVTLLPAATKTDYARGWEDLFGNYSTMTNREFAELSGESRESSERKLQELADSGYLSGLQTKNGALWSSRRIAAQR